MARVAAALGDAERHHRDKILPKDVGWGPSAECEPPVGERAAVDPVRARLHDLVARLGDALRFAPNPTAKDRLQTLIQIERYATGKLAYARIEAHLLGRE